MCVFLAEQYSPEFPESAVAHVAARQEREDTFADPASAATALRAANPFPTDEAIYHRIAHGLTEAAPRRWTWRHDHNVERPPEAPALDELWARWRQTTAPSLVVRGEHSPYLPGSLAERMAAARPGVRLNVVADAGHNVPTDQPTAFGSAVANWLDTIFNSSDT